ncbi:MAG: hypothetical protein GY749_07335 [Desulfobacteraceae bacterium]|nr:hypothetical protein [Desulfobacteraceae bacterium]
MKLGIVAQIGLQSTSGKISHSVAMFVDGGYIYYFDPNTGLWKHSVRAIDERTRKTVALDVTTKFEWSDYDFQYAHVYKK